MNRCRFLSWLALMLLMNGFATATETRSWIVDTAEEFLEGRGSDVQVSIHMLRHVFAKPKRNLHKLRAIIFS